MIFPSQILQVLIHGIWQKRNISRKQKHWWSASYPQDSGIVFTWVFSISHLCSQQVLFRAVAAKGACSWFRGQALWTSGSPACCSACWSAQFEESTAKGALERKHRLYSFVLLILWREQMPAQVTFSLIVSGGCTANTVILSGLSAINLTFVSCPSCPSSIWMSVEIKARCHRGEMPLFSPSQLLILKRFVSWSVWACCWEHMNRESAGAEGVVGLIF